MFVYRIPETDPIISDRMPKIKEIVNNVNDFFKDVTGRVYKTPEVVVYYRPDSTNSRLGALRANVGLRDGVGFFESNYPENIFISESLVNKMGNTDRTLGVSALEYHIAHEASHFYGFLAAHQDKAEQYMPSKINESVARFFGMAFATRNQPGSERPMSIASAVMEGGFSGMLSYAALRSKLRKNDDNAIKPANLGRYSSNAFTIEVFRQNDFDVNKTINELLRLDAGEVKGFQLGINNRYGEWSNSIKQETLAYRKVLVKSVVLAVATTAGFYEISSSAIPRVVFFTLPLSILVGAVAFDTSFEYQATNHPKANMQKRLRSISDGPG